MKNFKSWMWIPLLFLACQKEEDPEALIREIIHHYEEKQSMSYEIDYLWKDFDSDQAWYLETKVALKKDSKDTIFGGTYLYRRKDSLFDYSKYYHSEKAYVFDHQKRQQTIYDRSSGYSPITQNADFQSTKVYFLDLDNLKRKMTSSKVERKFTENPTHLVLQIFFPEEENYTEKEERIYFNKEEKTIDRITFQAKYHQQTQQNTWALRNIFFDQIESDYFEKETQKWIETYDSQAKSPENIP